MALEWLLQVWLKAFKAEGISEEIALDEYKEWAEGLGGELDHEFNQTEFSVRVAAEEAISELRSYES